MIKVLRLIVILPDKEVLSPLFVLAELEWAEKSHLLSKTLIIISTISEY